AALAIPFPNGTLLYDAVASAADDILKPREGRKVIIVLSDGDDNGSRSTLKTAIEAAQRADTLVYTFQIAPGPSHWARLSTETGGHYFPYGSSLPAAFSEIRYELRNQYSLGFDLQGTKPLVRSIKLRTKDKDFMVQARTSYYVAP
ncbi:MAG: VWA domain-containing protein, partial [Acidobacteriota bacterium]